MTEFTAASIQGLDARQFATLVKQTPDRTLVTTMSGPDRGPILDAIFNKMPDLFRPERAGQTNAVIHWSITDGPDGGSSTYQVAIADGKCTVTASPDQDPRLAVTIGPVDFLKIIAGRGNPTMMFMTGKLKAKGDLGLATSIANLFELPRV